MEGEWKHKNMKEKTDASLNHRIKSGYQVQQINVLLAQVKLTTQRLMHKTVDTPTNPFFPNTKVSWYSIW